MVCGEIWQSFDSLTKFWSSKAQMTRSNVLQRILKFNFEGYEAITQKFHEIKTIEHHLTHHLIRLGDEVKFKFWGHLGGQWSHTKNGKFWEIVKMFWIVCLEADAVGSRVLGSWSLVYFFFISSSRCSGGIKCNLKFSTVVGLAAIIC